LNRQNVHKFVGNPKNKITCISCKDSISANSPSKPDYCPCGSGKNYDKCCKEVHTFEYFDANVEQVARARYSAYALGVSNYLIQTSYIKNKVYQYLANIYKS
jgi:uncharacterized protein YchJ